MTDTTAMITRGAGVYYKASAAFIRRGRSSLRGTISSTNSPAGSIDERHKLPSHSQTHGLAGLQTLRCSSSGSTHPKILHVARSRSSNNIRRTDVSPSPVRPVHIVACPRRLPLEPQTALTARQSRRLPLGSQAWQGPVNQKATIRCFSNEPVLTNKGEAAPPPASIPPPLEEPGDGGEDEGKGGRQETRGGREAKRGDRRVEGCDGGREEGM